MYAVLSRRPNRCAAALVLLPLAICLHVAALLIPSWLLSKHESASCSASLWSGKLCTSTESFDVTHRPPPSDTFPRTWWNKLIAVRAFSLLSIVVGIMALVAILFGAAQMSRQHVRRSRMPMEAVSSWLAFVAAMFSSIAISLFASVLPSPPATLDVGAFVFALGILVYVVTTGVFDMRSPSRLRLKLVCTLVLIAYTCTPMLGGVFNHVRGGWNPASVTWIANGTQLLAHDGIRRFIMAGPTALLVAVASLSKKRSIPLFLVFGALTYTSLFVGWGCYFSIGRSRAGRAGVFDWLVGREGEDWTFHRRWLRDIVAMSLRGALWTAPTGYLLHLLGYGALPLLSGLCMGIWYQIGWVVPSTMHAVGQGIGNAEFMWGYWIWFTLLISFARYHNSRWASERQSYAEPPGLKWARPAGRVFVHVWVGVLQLIFVLSSYSYGLVAHLAKQQHISWDDRRNRYQTLLGLVVQVAAIAILQLWCLGSGLHSWFKRNADPPNSRRGSLAASFTPIESGLRASLLDSTVPRNRLPLLHAVDTSNVNTFVVSSSSSSSESSDDDVPPSPGLVFSYHSRAASMPVRDAVSPVSSSHAAGPWHTKLLQGALHDLRRLSWITSTLYALAMLLVGLWMLVWACFLFEVLARDNHNRHWGCGGHYPPGFCP